MNVKSFGTQKEAQIMDLVPPRQPITLHYDIAYDSTKPEQTLRNFVTDIRGMLSRYDGNKNRINEIEQELQDIYHYMEIASFKRAPDGYKLYRKIAELRRERRACKNEIDLLWPIYEYFHGTEILNKLTYVQGEVAKCQEAIDNRVYAVRTDILDGWFESEKPEEPDDEDEDESFMNVDLTINDPDVPITEIDVVKEHKKKYKKVFDAANA